MDGKDTTKFYFQYLKKNNCTKRISYLKYRQEGLAKDEAHIIEICQNHFHRIIMSPGYNSIQGRSESESEANHPSKGCSICVESSLQSPNLWIDLLKSDEIPPWENT